MISIIDIFEYMKLSREERQTHIDLSQPCIERGGDSTNHRGVLAQFLKTSIPEKTRKIYLCHACKNSRCSNPQHLYWGTPYENNVIDGPHDAEYRSINQKRLDKYGVLTPWQKMK